MSEVWSLTLVSEQTFLSRTIKLVRSFKDGFSVGSAGQEMYLGLLQYCPDTLAVMR